MKKQSSTASQEFNILCIGQRGVGKTVFLAASYAQTHQPQQTYSWQLEAKDRESQQNLEKILAYIAETGQYPPPTMKITDFCLRAAGQKKTREFRWWDLPGEICTLENQEFQELVLQSHGCCLFINAYALVYNPQYRQELEAVFKPVVAIASLVEQHQLPYRFALVLTQCDRLSSDLIGRLQIEEQLPSLLERLNAVNAEYSKFYSSAPIVEKNGTSVLEAAGAAEALGWLLAGTSSGKPQPTLKAGLQKGISRRPSRKPARALLVGTSAVALVAVALFGYGWMQRSSVEGDQFRKYQQVLEVDPTNSEALMNLASLYMESGQTSNAVLMIEKLAEQNPDNTELQFNLAKIYEDTGQMQKAEQVYDRLLAEQQNNLRALLSKAVLRKAQGDTQTAQTLFTQAEAAAPTDALKEKIRSLAQSTLEEQTAP
ncbi:MAG: tetratricopeptide repeat protein [Cyanophyceae cyanobacterium]